MSRFLIVTLFVLAFGAFASDNFFERSCVIPLTGEPSESISNLSFDISSSLSQIRSELNLPEHLRKNKDPRFFSRFRKPENNPVTLSLKERETAFERLNEAVSTLFQVQALLAEIPQARGEFIDQAKAILARALNQEVSRIKRVIGKTKSEDFSFASAEKSLRRSKRLLEATRTVNASVSSGQKLDPDSFRLLYAVALVAEARGINLVHKKTGERDTWVAERLRSTASAFNLTNKQLVDRIREVEREAESSNLELSDEQLVGLVEISLKRGTRVPDLISGMKAIIENEVFSKYEEAEIILLDHSLEFGNTRTVEVVERLEKGLYEFDLDPSANARSMLVLLISNSKLDLNVVLDKYKKIGEATADSKVESVTELTDVILTEAALSAQLAPEEIVKRYESTFNALKIRRGKNIDNEATAFATLTLVKLNVSASEFRVLHGRISRLVGRPLTVEQVTAVVGLVSARKGNLSKLFTDEDLMTALNSSVRGSGRLIEVLRERDVETESTDDPKTWKPFTFGYFIGFGSTTVNGPIFLLFNTGGFGLNIFNGHFLIIFSKHFVFDVTTGGFAFGWFFKFF